VSSEVAAIWVEGSNLANRFKRRITLYGNNNERHSIHTTQGCYDLLSYPLFFPRGSLAGIQISLSARCLGTLRSDQERTVRMKVRLFKILLHVLPILFVFYLNFFFMSFT
jgi:hypothetical protein